nr:tetraspanin-13b isoform X2 [Syngnathus scovelli]
MGCAGFTCSKHSLCALNILYVFSVSSACLAINKEQQDHLLEVGWNNSRSTQKDVEKTLNCCGFRQVDLNATCPAACFPNHSCLPCADKIQEHADEVLRFVGGTGLFFSFTEIVGVWLTYRYRNQKDPRANPSAFL